MVLNLLKPNSLKNNFRFENIANKLALFLLGLYRTFGTQFLGGSCRFTPSCSQYSVEAFHRHNFLCALKLTLLRLSKCRPYGPFGYDPVPLNIEKRGVHARTTK